MAAKFTWDKLKARTNQAKHRVSFDEALTVFADPLARIFDDIDHSTSENREIIVGCSERQRLLLVCLVKRLQSGSSAPGVRPVESAAIMKKTKARKKISRDTVEDMRREYRFDYRNARPNRFARLMRDTVTVTLDPDVATVFQSSASVNSLLRSVISAFPRQPRKQVKSA